jgi:hypothetical protein
MRRRTSPPRSRPNRAGHRRISYDLLGKLRYECRRGACRPRRLSRRGRAPSWSARSSAGSRCIGKRVCDWIGWAWTLIRRSYRFDPERRAIVKQTLAALEHDAFPTAQRSVRKTAVTLGFNRAESWKDLSREIKSDPGRAENTFRHLEAMRLTRVNNIGSTMTNADQNLIVELAYRASRGAVSNGVVQPYRWAPNRPR